MSYKSINPYTNKVIFEKPFESNATTLNKLKQLSSSFLNWKTNVTIPQRIHVIEQIKFFTANNKQQMALAASQEMGKPITESEAELDKCILLCDYYINNSESILKQEIIHTEAQLSYVSNEPIGVILGIMPWNFPFWQVFRFIIPTLIAGNLVALKHAPNVGLCAEWFEKLAISCQMEDYFKVLYCSHNTVESVINQGLVQGVSLTGSTVAGKIIGEIAGRNIIPTVLELGGSNAMLVFEDANITKASELIIKGRFLNAGQSCIASKRIIIHEKVYNAVKEQVLTLCLQLKTGNPLDASTNIGPLARIDLAENLINQVNKSIALGANLLTKINYKGCLISPIILADVKPNMPVFLEETFGPVLSLVKAQSTEDMIRLSNQSNFGLGVSLVGENIEILKSLIPKFNEGAVFINDIVKSDPRLPFGGVKQSGIGRELGKDGLLAFVNRKTVVVNS